MEKNSSVRSLTRSIKNLFSTKKGINPHAMYPNEYCKHYYFNNKLSDGIALVAKMERTSKKQAAEHLMELGFSSYMGGMIKQQIKMEKIAIQLQHGGRWATPIEGKQTVSASDFPPARAATIEEIKTIQAKFAEATRRAKLARFDAVVINGGAGTLLTQFLSPRTNKRMDEYGGNLQGRMRFVLEIVQMVQDKVGKDFPIIFDSPADEVIEGGFTLEDSKVLVQRLEEIGVSAFRIHSGTIEPPCTYLIMPPAAIPIGFQVHYAEETKKVLHTAKVMVGRRIGDPVYANSVIEQGKADMIVFGRPLLADAELPNKAAAGKLEEIRKCIWCNTCTGRVGQSLLLKCAVNPATGREKEAEIVPAAKSKKVLIAGGGPAGMEAAMVATLRGHKVTLYEKSDTLGGQLNIAAVPPYKQDIIYLKEYLTYQLRKLGVRTELETDVTKKLIANEKPEIIIIATGAKPLIPRIPGVDQENVVLAWDILAGKKKATGKIVTIGGGYVGCETAEYLAQKGIQVTILEQLPDVALDVEPATRTLLLRRLSEYGIRILTNTKVEEITNRGVVFTDKSQSKQTEEANTIILAVGSVSNKHLEGLTLEFPQVYSIGDCLSPRKILEAVHEGWWVATQM